MFVSGFTFIRNAVKLDYPVKEAILSVLPLVDEMVVAVGLSEDTTRDLILSLGPKIRIIDTVWDDSLREGGKVLASETNKAFDAVDKDADWCVYIQGDECIHEKHHGEILAAMDKYANDDRVDGLLFNYSHFYGSYDYLGDSRTWYRKEIRVIKNDKEIRSYRDAQGFRKNNRKLNVKATGAEMYHYGWVRHPKYQMAKLVEANKLWHDDDYIAKKFNSEEDFDYSEIDSIRPFEGTHPKVMHSRISEINWSFDKDPSVKSFGPKLRFLYLVEKLTGWRIGEYKNYKLI
ncbi:MAG: glycosyl transferase [Bacteroidetes bacterium]|nr:MAG: glycosyl transferase [Bacteroidota bacterium]